MPRTSDMNTGVRIWAKVSTIEPMPIVAAITSTKKRIRGHFF
jgi:hypothetical protein